MIRQPALIEGVWSAYISASVRAQATPLEQVRSFDLLVPCDPVLVGLPATAQGVDFG